MGDSNQETHIRQAIASCRARGQEDKALELEEFLAGPTGEEDPPDEGDFVWRAFLELSGRRAVGASMGGIVLSPITHHAMTEWSSGQGFELSPWELMAISRLDDIYLEVQRKHMTARANKK